MKVPDVGDLKLTRLSLIECSLPWQKKGSCRDGRRPHMWLGFPISHLFLIPTSIHWQVQLVLPPEPTLSLSTSRRLLCDVISPLLWITLPLFLPPAVHFWPSSKSDDLQHSQIMSSPCLKLNPIQVKIHAPSHGPGRSVWSHRPLTSSFHPHSLPCSHSLSLPWSC